MSELKFDGFGYKEEDLNVTKKRNVYIGGSDIPTLLGINKYKTEFELAQEKAGIVVRPFITNPYIQFGNQLEPDIRNYINSVNQLNFVVETYVNEEKRIRSNVDGIDKEHRILLEVKTHGVQYKQKVYEAQMQLYMDQIGCDYGWLALYKRPKSMDIEFDKENLVIKEIERDAEWIKEIHEKIERFWEKLKIIKQKPEMTFEEWSEL